MPWNALAFFFCCCCFFNCIALPFFLYHRMMKILWFGGVFGFITCKMTLAAVFSVPQFSVLMLVMIAVDHFFCSTSTFAGVSESFQRHFLGTKTF